MEFSGENNESGSEKSNLRNVALEEAESGGIVRYTDAIDSYRKSQEVVISETFKGELFQRAQIEILLDMAMLYGEMEFEFYRLAELEDALIYARNRGFDDLEALIKSEIRENEGN